MDSEIRPLEQSFDLDHLDQLTIEIEVDSKSQTDGSDEVKHKLRIDVLLKPKNESLKSSKAEEKLDRVNTAQFDSEPIPGHLPKSAFEPRWPPLGSYVHVKLTFYDFASKTFYVRLEEDIPVFDYVVGELGVCDEKIRSGEETMSLNDLCEGETLVVAIHPKIGVPARARVLKVVNLETISLFFIDYGSTAQVPLSLITPLMLNSVLRICETVIGCKLSSDFDEADVLQVFGENECIRVAFGPDESSQNTETKMWTIQRIELLDYSNENDNSICDLLNFNK